MKSKLNENKILTAPFLREMIEATYTMWNLGWDERNGGNISYLLTEEDLSSYLDLQQATRTIHLAFPVKELSNRYFVVTGSGKYFKNVRDYPENCLGVIKVNYDGTAIDLLWGLEDGGMPTSELPAHFMSHVARLQVDNGHRIIMHTHATNIIAMTFSHNLNERIFTKTLWQMCTECIIVFPDGVAVLPWMIPGTEEIGVKTAERMRESRLVIWPHHGIFGAGCSMDETFGLIETVEKAAQIYMLISSHREDPKQVITDRQLVELANAFGVTPREGILS